MSLVTAKKKAAGREKAKRSRTGPQLRYIGLIRSTLKTRGEAPMQGSEGAPDAWIDIFPSARQGFKRMEEGSEVIILTWLHRADRDVLKVHPRSDRNLPLTGVFFTRSPDRPNPVGLHRVTVRKITDTRLLVGPIEAIDGTPVIDIKPVLPASRDS